MLAPAATHASPSRGRPSMLASVKPSLTQPAPCVATTTITSCATCVDVRCSGSTHSSMLAIVKPSPTQAAAFPFFDASNRQAVTDTGSSVRYHYHHHLLCDGCSCSLQPLFCTTQAAALVFHSHHHLLCDGCSCSLQSFFCTTTITSCAAVAVVRCSHSFAPPPSPPVRRW